MTKKQSVTMAMATKVLHILLFYVCVSGGVGDSGRGVIDADLVGAFMDKIESQNGLIESLVNRVDHLEARDTAMVEEMGTLRQRIKDLEANGNQNLIHDLQAENDDLRKRVSYLEQRERDAQNDVNGTHAQIRQQHHVRKIRPDETSGANTLRDEAAGNADRKTNILRRRRDAGNRAESTNRRVASDRTRRQTYEQTNVAFFAALSAHLEHQGVDQPIAFDNVLTNYGDAYSATIGDFRAPVTGTYVFSVTLMAYISHTTHYYYAKNGTPVSNIYVRGQESPYASSSQTAVLELAKGDSITIMNGDADESLHGSGYSTFSGFLLRESFGADNHVLG